MLVFAEGGKQENLEKNPRSREENQLKLNPLMASDPGIEPGPHWWEASALTTAPSLLLYLHVSSSVLRCAVYGTLVLQLAHVYKHTNCKSYFKVKLMYGTVN